MTGSDLRQGSTTTADGLELAYLEVGEGPLALCLHGFPDSPHTWRHLLPALADAGFRAVAPWMRGYAPSGVPADGRYQSAALATDAAALHDALGGGQPGVLIGHDWGALATYPAAAHEPERWRRVVTMAVPPAAVLLGGMLTVAQANRSWYIWLFQMPGLAEMVLTANELELVDRLWSDWSPGYDAAAEVAEVKAALAEPANVAAALGYYRALFDPSAHDPALADAQAAAQAPLPQPTLYLHGVDDGCMGAEMVDDTVLVGLPAEGSRYEVLDGCGHFLHLERPDEVNRLVVDFVSA